MQCEYVGNYDEPHKMVKKRRMIGSQIHQAVEKIVNKSLSCETYREREACRLMKIGKYMDLIVLIFLTNFCEPVLRVYYRIMYR